MFGHIPSYLPKQDVRSYRVGSLLLYILFTLILVYGAMSFLFPYQRYTFDFNNPDATKNNLFEPHLNNFSSVIKGKIPALDNLFIYANNPQVLETSDISITPSDSTTASLEDVTVKVHRGWSATFFPIGEELDIPTIKIVTYGGNFYEERDNILYPLVSEAAAKSWVPENRIIPIPQEAFEKMPKSDTLAGFRPGTLLAYADGVFFVTEEGTIRPFGSAEVLLRSGYSFNHIISASGEDVGIYKRGKIILPGELHLGGTLFRDTDTQKTFLFQGEKMKPLTTAYTDFLATQNDVILFSSTARNQEVSCRLTKKILQKNYACQVDVSSLQGRGNDYQITVHAPAHETDIQMIQVGLQSSRQPDNARATLRSLTSRVLERIGLY